MKLSVITVCYNSASTIEETIRSVASQRHRNLEHIIVDGGSTDETPAIIARHRQHIATLVSERDHGMYDAMNKGIARATGDAIGFLNADDVYSDDAVTAQIASVFEHEDLDACYGDLVYVDRMRPERVVRYWKSRPYAEGLLAKGWMPAHPTFFVRANIYRTYGGYNLSYRRQADFEMVVRFFLKARIRTVYIPRVLVRMRSGGASSGVVHIIRGNIEAYRACRENGLNVSPFFIVRKILSRVPQFFDKPTAAEMR
jgi:glycosyltransferase involved in cell wall biosynthesis